MTTYWPLWVIISESARQRIITIMPPDWVPPTPSWKDRRDIDLPVSYPTTQEADQEMRKKPKSRLQERVS